MITLIDKDPITEQDLYNLIHIGAEESINLEFKRADSLKMTELKKAEIAKDVSSFANSAGGIIIYGMSEKGHKAESISPIDGDVYSKEWLEQVIHSRIQRKIDDLHIIPIRLGQKVSETIYIVKIPESPLAPHMTSDKKFYKRYNFESVQMEEYEIRNLYTRREKTKLLINNIVRIGQLYDEERVTYCNLGFQIENIGKAVEKDYKLFVEMNFIDYNIKWDPITHTNNFNHSMVNSNRRIMSFFGISPIFPDEVLTIGYVDFGLPIMKSEEILKSGIFSLKLLYTNGIDEMEIPLKDIFKT